MNQHTEKALNTSANGKPKLRVKRLLLLVVLPILIVAAAIVVYLMGGRYVETDNAYVKADMSLIGADIAGTVVQVAVKDNQHVEAGQLLFKVDAQPYQIALAQAQANLNDTVSLLKALKANYYAKQASIAAAQNELAYLQREQQRKQDLLKQHYVSESDYDAARQDTVQEKMQISTLMAELKLAEEGLGGDVNQPIEQNPKYLKAKASLAKAEYDLSRVTVVSPTSGVVTHVIELGEYLAPGKSALMLVADKSLWVEANFTEKDLTHVNVGQPVEIHVDYQPDLVWHGEVASMSPATGSEFAVIPAQNATGNWVKVAQRLPIRIHIDDNPHAPRLRAGLSADVTIDTGHRRSLHW
ncbi:hemolysin D [Shewanella mangrovi]|uniref:Hemolysin D n=1 Tax=Shewanella mangrovi TaxID=1515746 RepID=A0A094K2I1_9GAMM|nr:HlyD family secretion protein [Shewanella mangrovi]KFZ38851.1 hemolysin D [Shewanella mangrovi]